MHFKKLPSNSKKAGYDNASGDAIITMDMISHPPKLISLFIDSWEKGNEIVWYETKNKKRLDFKKSFSKTFYFFIWIVISKNKENI